MTSTYYSCPHPGHTVIFMVDGIKFYGSKVSNVHWIDNPYHLILACASYHGDEPILTLPDGFDDLAEFEIEQTVLRIDWDDFGVPRLHPEFWHKLIKIAKKENINSITACCVGSHGRTGTALAALAIVGRKLTAYKAVQLIRKQHCDQAVESEAQIDYLQEVEEWAYEKDIIKGVGPRPEKRPIKSYTNPQSQYYKGGVVSNATKVTPAETDKEEFKANEAAIKQIRDAEDNYQGIPTRWEPNDDFFP